MQEALPPPPKELELSHNNKKFTEQVMGTFLYYGRTFDLTVLHSLSAIACAKNTDKKQH